MKILIPTDFSHTSKSLIEQIVNSLHETETLTEILILNTFIVKETDPEQVIVANDKLKSESKTSLEELKSLTMSKILNPNVQIQTVSHLGTLKNVIQQILKKERFDQLAVTKEQASELTAIKDFLRERACSFVIK
jgi:hypothetical protein